VTVKTPSDISSDGKAIPVRAWYPSHEARVLLGGMSESAFRRLTLSGELRSKKRGRSVLVAAGEIEDFMARQPDGTSPSAGGLAAAS
jgi:hypothetical protein